MLDSDMNSRYWKYILHRYVFIEKSLKIFLAVMASGTVASWGIWSTIPILWKTLSAISAIVAIISPILDYSDKVKKVSFICGKWVRLKEEYNFIWIKFENNLLENTSEFELIKSAYLELKNEQINLGEKEIQFSVDNKLLNKCYNEVKKSRGLN